MLDDIFEVVFLICFVAGSVIRGVCTRRHKRDRLRLGPDTPLLMLAGVGMIVVPLVYVLTPWLDFADYHLPTWLGWVGAVLFVGTLWLLWKSHVDLGRNWSPWLEILEGHALVTHGVYRHIRHPMYAAHLLWAIAQALLLQNWIAGLAMLAFFLPLCLLRVPREERMMLEHFGEAYRSYVNRTGRVIPRLWR